MPALARKTPCPSCPFVKANKFPLHPARVRELAENAAFIFGGFTCHKTIDYSERDTDDDGNIIEPVYDPNERECAGHLYLKHRVNGETVMHPDFDPDRVEGCFESPEEMIEELT